MHVFLATGEPSGDLHGAHLAHALRAQHPTITISGVGGTRMRAAGVSLFAESEHWGAIGIPEALRKVPGLLWQQQRLVRHLRALRPDVLVAIDFGAFNVRLLRRLRGSGIRTVYYIPPGCWSRTRAAGELPWLADAIATPFAWSAERLRAAGGPAQVEWVGHPLLDYCRVDTTRAQARGQLGLADDRPVVALVPGSRRSELRYLLPVFAAALQAMTPAPQVLVAVAPSLGQAAVQRLLPAGLDVRLLDGLDYALMQAADAALVASGTATLELACLGVPMVVAYRGSFASWLQYRIIVRGGGLRFIALPNILADAPVVPELLQDAANPAALAAALTPLVSATPARQAQLDAFTSIRALLGEGQAVSRTATLIDRTFASAGSPPLGERGRG